MLAQHYHTSTNLSRKLNASLRYLQLQLGTPNNPFMMDFVVWGHLAPLSWVKMLWQTLHHFDIHLHMSYPSIPPPRERDQVLMETILSQGLSWETMQSLNQCRLSLESIFLLDLTTADGRYLEDFIFNPGGRVWSSSFKFPCEVPTRADWNCWFNFWHDFTITGDNLKVTLGNWINPMHRIWKWYYRAAYDDLYRVDNNLLVHYKPSVSLRFTRLTRTYHRSFKEPLPLKMDHGSPISVAGLAASKVVKLSTGPGLATVADTCTGFWEFLHSWGGDVDVGSN